MFQPLFFRELSFLEVNSPLPYLACKWRHHHSSLGLGWLRSPLWVACFFHTPSSMLSIFNVSSFICSLVLLNPCVCVNLNPTLFFLSWAWEMNLHIYTIFITLKENKINLHQWMHHNNCSELDNRTVHRQPWMRNNHHHPWNTPATHQ